MSIEYELFIYYLFIIYLLSIYLLFIIPVKFLFKFLFIFLSNSLSILNNRSASPSLFSLLSLLSLLSFLLLSISFPDRPLPPHKHPFCLWLAFLALACGIARLFIFVLFVLFFVLASYLYYNSLPNAYQSPLLITLKPPSQPLPSPNHKICTKKMDPQLVTCSILFNHWPLSCACFMIAI